ncbi:MAG: CoB--CoM heterodisulfide reductase iron-sulfur subunit A family protein, partial [Candidatus Heimdallarchaeota archaeon]|nr:CoB--CoM heterodisulfide reductase iron-sulfur subunit A family protein [Candidatus Heimdallarchaeota archaeon]MCK5048792.1 CoB--CoM heterodisulfide reductase iron-sulfur subunit A family protein [Candidatus Heimdallarchaeota archaeon]
MSEEELRVGVFVCKCGKNIAHTIDCDAVAEYAKDLPDVVFTGVNMFSCSDPGQQEIEDKIQEHNLNRVVVAACTPRTHEPIFRECVKRAGVNQYLFELANIREHASWVHQKEPEKATEKAKDIVNMAVSKARLLEPLEDLEVNMEPASLIIGAGIAGIRAALDIADQGYQVVLVEKKPTIGGIMALIDKTFPTQDCSICILGPLMTEVGRHPNVKLISNAVVERIDGYVGNFDVSVRKFARFVDESLCKNCGDCADVCPVTVPNEFDENISWRKAIYIPFPQAVPSARVIDPDDCLGMNPITCGKCRDVCEPKAINYDDQDEVFDYKIGTIIVSTGFEIADPLDNPEFGWGRFKNVLTSMEFERIINAAGPTDGHLVRPSDHVEPQKIAFIQCVGSRDVNNNPYCSVFCCMETIKSSLLIKEHYPDAEITVYYMDIRAAGKRFEEIYTSSREQGVKYIRSSIAEIKEDPLTKNLFLSGEDTTKGKYINNEHDLVVLSMGAQKSNESELPLPLSRTPENFYMEAHPKLKPVDTPTAGV